MKVKQDRYSSGKAKRGGDPEEAAVAVLVLGRGQPAKKQETERLEAMKLMHEARDEQSNVSWKCLMEAGDSGRGFVAGKKMAPWHTSFISM